MLLRKEDLKDFFSIIAPKIEKSIKFQGMLPEEVEEYKQRIEILKRKIEEKNINQKN